MVVNLKILKTILEENEKGKKKIRFTPLSPVETSIAIE